jgi:hypothetical protein
MLTDATYRQWTSPFCEGSYFSGSFDKGARILFLSPGNCGMVAEIAESRAPEFVSIRHLGTINAGVEDTTSEEARKNFPAYENYTFHDAGNGSTRLVVDSDTSPEYKDYMERVWPVALNELKRICESQAA